MLGRAVKSQRTSFGGRWGTRVLSLLLGTVVVFSTIYIHLGSHSSGSLTAAGMIKKKLAGGINQATTHQAAPAISADNSQLFYMYKNPANKRDQLTGNWDIYYARRIGTYWSKGRPLTAINADFFQGYPSITADGRSLYYVANTLARLNSENELRQDLDIYVVHRRGQTWGEPQKLPDGINWNGRDENGASISPDGNRLVFFAPEGDDDHGGYDIYMAYRDRRGRWGDAQNIGPAINTSANETAPYLAPDGQTLYFSSDRSGGYGSYDLYKSVFRKGTWSTPTNLGPGVNTKGLELGLTIAANGYDVYLSTLEPQGTWNIYKSTLPTTARPKKVMLVKARVRSRAGQKPLEATIVLEDLDTGKYLGKFATDPSDGEATMALVKGRRYSVTITAPQHLFLTDNFDLKGLTAYRETVLTWALSPVKKGQSVIIKNIFFEPESYTLDKKSKLALDRLIAFLKKSPGIRLEISGHTDSIGSSQENQALSERRAKSVLHYFTSRDLAAHRFATVGYGNRRPVATNNTEDGRRRNRRTEFKILTVEN